MSPLREGVLHFGQDLWYNTLKGILTEPVGQALGGIQVAGLENIPTRGPALLVGNHRTASDPFLVSGVVPRRIHYVVAAFMGKLPFASHLANSTGNIVLPVSKGGKSLELMRNARRLLKRGRLVGVFPEGMDNFLNGSPPGSVSNFHTTFARLIVGLQMPFLPIIPIGLTGEEERVVLTVPGAVMKMVDPHIPVDGSGKVIMPVFNRARIAIGRPLTFPEVVDLAPEDRENFVRHIVDTVRSEVVRLVEAHTVAVHEAPKLVPMSADGFFDESDVMG